MATRTKIEWTEITWNVTTGCTKVSKGCQNCYAEKMHKRLRAMGQKKYQQPFSEVVCHESELNRDFGSKPKRIFVNSMSDLFHKDVPFEFIDRVFSIMAANPQHTFQILTKRPERMLEWNNWTEYLGGGDFLKNLWLGVSVEDQKTADERIPLLLQIPAKIRFLSIEPMLDEIELGLFGTLPKTWGKGYSAIYEHLHWVIVGGESGQGARPMHPDWVRSIRDQCGEAGVPFLLKQMVTEKGFTKMPELDGKVWNEYPQ